MSRARPDPSDRIGNRSEEDKEDEWFLKSCGTTSSARCEKSAMAARREDGESKTDRGAHGARGNGGLLNRADLKTEFTAGALTKERIGAILKSEDKANIGHRSCPLLLSSG